MPKIHLLKWDNAPNTLVRRFSEVGFYLDTQLVVSESQTVLFVKGGRVYAQLEHGEYTLNPQNFPFVTKGSGAKYTFDGEVWLIQKNSIYVKWGTSQAVDIEDPKYHVVLPVRAYGSYGVKIVNQQRFVDKLIEELPIVTAKTFVNHFRALAVTRTMTYVGAFVLKNECTILQIAGSVNEISMAVHKQMAEELKSYGLEVFSFEVNSISVPEDDPTALGLKSALSKRAEMNLVGYTYQQERSFDTMDLAAVNESPGASLINVGVNSGLAAPISNAMRTMSENIQVAPDTSLSHQQKTPFYACPNCSAQLTGASNFCPACGTKLQKRCANCGLVFNTNVRFCTNCGSAV